MTLNLNDIIKFKPTQLGLKIIVEDENAVLGTSTTVTEYKQQYLTQDGNTAMQLRCFANIFGPFLLSGADEVIVNNEFTIVKTTKF